MVGEIHLIRINDKKIVPGIVLQEYKKGNYLISRLKEPKKDELNIVYIGQPSGLKFKSVAIAYKLIKTEEKNILKYISNVTTKVVKEILDTNNKYTKNCELHKELHQLKKEINIAQFNNKPYKDLEKRKDEILEELGYPITQSNYRLGDYTRLRYIPSKSIKIYHGGR